jgi:hypothetical protein
MLDSILAWLQPVPERVVLDAGQRIRRWMDAVLCLRETTDFQSMEL